MTGSSLLTRAASWRGPAFAGRVLRWYGTVVFSPRPIPGLLVFLATLANPDWGVCGLVCALFTNWIGRFLEFPAAELESGIYGCNGILYGLYVGSHFSHPGLLVLLSVAGSFLVCLLTRGFTNSFGTFLKLPACSLPFVVAVMMVSSFVHSQEIAYGIDLVKPFSQSTGLLAAYLAKPFHLTPFEQITREVAWFLSSLGAIFFQKSGWACLMVGAALFASSRLLPVLAVAGFLGMRVVCAMLPFSCAGQETGLGFNAVLIAIAVGGFFFVPGRRAIVLMFFCQAVAVVLGLSLGAIGKLTGIEFTALPFNLLVGGALLMMQGRAFDAKPLQPAIAFSTPEEAFAYYRRYQERMFLRAVALPTLGPWKVVQGFDGPETHKEQWRFGLDLAAVDEAGTRFRSTGVNLEDYFAFNAVVRSPVDGTVAEVFDQIPDNPVGEMNLAYPWGNYVIIYSSGIYVGLYHLKQGSAGVVAGQFVFTGAPVGRGGNSGRSALPHLHFQVQLLPQAGAPNLPFLWRDVVSHEPEGETFHPFLKPQAGEVLAEIEPGDELRPFFLPAMGEVWRLKITEGEHRRQETWTFTYTLHGNLVIADERKDEAEFRLSTRSIEAVRIPDRLWSPLHLFALTVADLPFHFREGLRWLTTLYGRNATPLFRMKKRWLAEMVGDIFSLEYEKEFLDAREEPSVGQTVYQVRSCFPHRNSVAWLRETRIYLRFSLNGFVQLVLSRGGETVLTCEKISLESAS